MPAVSAVCGAEQCGVFYSRIDIIRIGERRFEVPDALELPRMLRAVIPLVGSQRLTSGGRSVIDEFVALPCRRGTRRRHHLASRSFPSLAAVARALDYLSEPAARLRCIQAIWVNRRALEVVDLPSGKVGAADIPVFALAVRRQDERTLPCPYQYPHVAHLALSLGLPEMRAVEIRSCSDIIFPYSRCATESKHFCRSGRGL